MNGKIHPKQNYKYKFLNLKNMKKAIIMAVLASAALASCDQKELITENVESESLKIMTSINMIESRAGFVEKRILRQTMKWACSFISQPDGEKNIPDSLLKTISLLKQHRAGLWPMKFTFCRIRHIYGHIIRII